MGRTQSTILPSSPVAVKAIEAPSGESTGGPAPSPARLIVVFSGGWSAPGSLGRMGAVQESSADQRQRDDNHQRNRPEDALFASSKALAALPPKRTDDWSAAIHCSSSLMSCAV